MGVRIRPVRVGSVVSQLARRRRPILLGSLGRTRPVDLHWGSSRGQPVDRWYIERFLGARRAVIAGRVLEVKDSGYTTRFGGDVTERAVLDIDAANPHATYVADLAAADAIPAARFDCFVLTQTLQYVYDLPGAIGHAHRILAPGGSLLATLPVVSRVTEPPLIDLWRFTPESARRLFAAAFGADAVEVTALGNVLAQIAFLAGLAVEDLDRAALDDHDPRFPLLVCVSARKAA
jgi:SAM-dependent methyltransferase